MDDLPILILGDDRDDGRPIALEVFLAKNHPAFLDIDIRFWLEPSGQTTPARVRDAVDKVAKEKAFV